MEVFITIISFLFATTGIVAVIGYLPTIKDLIRGIPSANILSYLIWTISNLISLLYIIFVVPDLLLGLVLGSNFLACLVILILAFRTKYKK